MKVLLTKDVTSLGRAGDVKDVSDGHARNFLIPKHLALPATSEVLARIQKEEQEHQAKVSRDHERFAAFKDKLEKQTITVKARATKNTLFAAIQPKEIALAVNEKLGLEISGEMVRLKQPVKTLGQHEIEIQFAKDLNAVVKLNVENS